MLLMVLGVLAYSNSVKGAFVWDDTGLVRDNPAIRSLSRIPGYFHQTIFEGVGQKSSFYRPLQMTSYAADYFLWGLSPAGYHLTNIMFHIAAALAVFWFVWTISEKRYLSLISAALFTVHPVHTEAVSYISGRADSMALFFMLIALVFYVRGIERQQFSLSAIAGISYVCALFSKETALFLPVIVVFYHIALNKKFRPENAAAMAAALVVYALLRSGAGPANNPSLLASIGFSRRLPGTFAAYFTYLRLLILPYGQHMEYGAVISVPGDLKVVAGFFLTIATVWGMYALRRDKIAFFAAGWFVLNFLPVSNIYPLNAYMAEHWMYVPSIGIFMLAASAMGALYHKKGFKPAVTVATAALIAFYLFLTVKQNLYWRDPVTFYNKTLFYNPRNRRMLNNLGEHYFERGRYDEAIATLQKALEISPNYASAYNNLGAVYVKTGRKQEAIDAFRRAVNIDPSFQDAKHNLDVMLKQR